jgi:hypothetical protein
MARRDTKKRSRRVDADDCKACGRDLRGEVAAATSDIDDAGARGGIQQYKKICDLSTGIFARRSERPNA